MHVLVATDGSPYGVRAAQHGIELLGHPGRVTLLRVLTHVRGRPRRGRGVAVHDHVYAELPRHVANAALLFAHSVSESVVRHAPCPVLVVPEPRATP